MEDTAFHTYIAEVQRQFKSGVATEHTYRPALIEFLKSISDDDYEIFNEPRRVNCGAPDILLSESGLPLGHIETKDLGTDLDDIEDSEQIVRYKKALPNLIVTNYLEFRWYVEGNLRDKFSIAELKSKKLVQSKEMIAGAKAILKAFLKVRLPVITSSSALAIRMAGLAQLIRFGIKKALQDSDKGGNLFHQLSSFKTILLPTLDEDEFADLYAQTLPYGLFTARLNMANSVLHRETASYAIPKSNPFLRRIFLNLAGPDLEDRVVWVVEDLVNLMNRVDFNALAEDFRHGQNIADPIIHFYETFLQAYDSDSRKSRGVYYTPLPIVNFIVRSVDQLLKQKFEIIDGLADDTKLTLVQDKKQKEYHRVTILDPATGTGTFLNESFKFLKKQFEGNEGLWAEYLKENVVPRFFGFEFLMTPYILAHMKLGIETEAFSKEASEEERLNIYLTNTLDEPKAAGQLFPFARWLSEEAAAANEVKKSAPVMVVMGNPPYAVSSQNRSDWINELIKDYKIGLNERKLNLDDDYIKFMKFAQWRIEQTGQGVIAMITNHSFIDGITHRRMRESLLESFDEIYVLDLHGNSVKATESPNGRKDENVFEIKQGVSINFLVRNNTKTKKYGQIFHCDAWGSKKEKYDILDANSWESLSWTPIELDEKYFFFVPTAHDTESDYTQFFPVNELFVVGSSGIQTKRDPLFVDDSADALAKRWEEILDNPTDPQLHQQYPLYESPGWSVNKLENLEYSRENIRPYWFRPFDKKFIYYDPQALGRARDKVMKHFLNDNFGIVTYRQTVDDGFRHVSFVDGLADINLVTNHHVSDRIYPGFLYEYWDLAENEAKLLQPSFAENGKAERVPNISAKFIKTLKATIGIDLVNDTTGSGTTCGVGDVINYVFAVLNSTEYRTAYWDWLKIEFPRVPLPKNSEIFWKIVEVGRKLTDLVTLQNVVSRTEYIGKFPIEGTGKVQKISFEDNKIFINKKQYFDEVPASVWQYSIGGYQVCEKWLKERKSSVLSSDSIRDFQKLLTHIQLVLESVSNLDALINELGGWQEISSTQSTGSLNIVQIFGESTLPIHIRDRLGLACLIIDAHEKQKLGRVKLAKIFYLLDQSTHLDLKTEYYRESAGPVALQAIYGKKSGIEALGLSEGLFETSEAKLRKDRKIITYKKTDKISSGIEYIKQRLGPSWDALCYKLETLSKLNSVQTEIVATLFACWNDLLLQKKNPTDNEIISEFRDNWSDRKKLFPPLRLKKALLWMRQNDFIPEGKGSKTKIRF